MPDTSLHLSAGDRKMLRGERGPAAKFAMGLIARTAALSGAEDLVDISWAHVTSSYYNGQVNLDFAEKLHGMAAKVTVPTTLAYEKSILALQDINVELQAGQTLSIVTMHPRHTAARIIGRPLEFYFGVGRQERREKTIELLDKIGLERVLETRCELNA